MIQAPIQLLLQGGQLLLLQGCIVHRLVATETVRRQLVVADLLQQAGSGTRQGSASDLMAYLNRCVAS